MAFTGFKKKDFNVFKIKGLDNRMTAIQENIQPKFQQLSETITPKLNMLTGEEMFAHIAKHARRTVNPPDDTWVAFADNKRGYKQHPHFQIGLWETHLFIWYALIYESPFKKDAAEEYQEHVNDIYNMIPEGFAFSEDHTRPEYIKKENCSTENVERMISRLGSIKKAEFLCGKIIPAEEAVRLTGKALKEEIITTFETVMPLYEIAKRSKSRV